MKALQEIAPELKKVQERYKDDKQRQQQEVMKFYQENKVNPLASCLPLVLQLPVFLSLYYMLRTDLKHEICGIRSPTRRTRSASRCSRARPSSSSSRT